MSGRVRVGAQHKPSTVKIPWSAEMPGRRWGKCQRKEGGRKEEGDLLRQSG